MLRYHIVVCGDVQGVGFRYYTQKSALLYGISGWVRNRADGTVEIDAEGEEANISGFIAAVGRGNSFSNVESTDIQRIKDPANYRTFEIADDEW